MKKPYERNVRLQKIARQGAGDSGHGAARLLDRVLIGNQNLRAAAAVLAQWCLSALIWPRFVAPYRWQLTRYALPLAGLHPAFDGYRILQLTDLHVGRTRQAYLERVIDRVFAEPVDLVVLTGDLIDYHPRSLPLIRPLLERLVQAAARAKVSDGIVAIFGNHDYHEYASRHNGPRSVRRPVHRRLRQMVLDSGIRLLRNESLRIPAHEGAHQSRDRKGAIGRSMAPGEPLSASDQDLSGMKDLVLVGMEEMWTGLADADRAFAGVRPDEPVICLQHNPDGIEFLKPYPWQVMLCGHSHGGQAVFPVLGPLYIPMECREYLQGFFQFPRLPQQPAALDARGGRKMFVSRGLGHTTPIRVQCPPEATIFTLTPLLPDPAGGNQGRSENG